MVLIRSCTPLVALFQNLLLQVHMRQGAQSTENSNQMPLLPFHSASFFSPIENDA
jgi:hypothetical protein